MLYYFNSCTNDTAKNICNKLSSLIESGIRPGQPIIIMCIGSDRSTGDSLGPIIGYKLQKLSFQNVFVYGSLDHPVNASNLQKCINYVDNRFLNPYIIAIDACLGQVNHIGYITLGTGPLKPGLGVKKKLPEVGDLHITGIVNSSGNMHNTLLQTTRLATIMCMADIISCAIIDTLIQLQIKTNVCSYTQPMPEKSFAQLVIS